MINQKNAYGIFLLFFSFFIANNVQAYEIEDNVSIRISPFGLLGGAISGEIPLRINKRLAIGPMFAYQNFDFGGTVNTLAGGGLRADWHFGQAFNDGAYLSLQTAYSNIENSITSKDKVFSRKGNNLSVITAIGYLWRWDNVTLNLAIGAGYSSFGNPDFLAEDGEIYDNPIPLPDLPVAIGGDFSLGWAF